MEAKGRATSRRNFLKLGGISALGALSAGALSACGYQEYTPYADGAVGVAGNGSTTANGLPSFMQAPEPIAKVAETVDCDVLVIGAGAAGTPAALSAVENGAKVVLLQKERTAMSHGNSAAGLNLDKCGSGGHRAFDLAGGEGQSAPFASRVGQQLGLQFRRGAALVHGPHQIRRRPRVRRRQPTAGRYAQHQRLQA